MKDHTMIEGKYIIEEYHLRGDRNLFELVQSGLQPYDALTEEPIPAPDYQEFLDLNQKYNGLIAGAGISSYAFSDEIRPLQETPSYVKKEAEAKMSLVFSRLPNAKADRDYYSWKNYQPGSREQRTEVFEILREALFFEKEALELRMPDEQKYSADFYANILIAQCWSEILNIYGAMKKNGLNLKADSADERLRKKALKEFDQNEHRYHFIKRQDLEPIEVYSLSDSNPKRDFFKRILDNRLLSKGIKTSINAIGKKYDRILKI